MKEAWGIVWNSNKTVSVAKRFENIRNCMVLKRPAVSATVAVRFGRR